MVLNHISYLTCSAASTVVKIDSTAATGLFHVSYSSTELFLVQNTNEDVTQNKSDTQCPCALVVGRTRNFNRQQGASFVIFTAIKTSPNFPPRKIYVNELKIKQSAKTNLQINGNDRTAVLKSLYQQIKATFLLGLKMCQL